MDGKCLWTADELDRLCGMLATGASINHVAKAIGRPPSAVRARARSLDRLPAIGR